jgi:hypothetical protein
MGKQSHDQHGSSAIKETQQAMKEVGLREMGDGNGMDRKGERMQWG